MRSNKINTAQNKIGMFIIRASLQIRVI